MKQKTKFKETEIGKIPEEWEIVEMGNLGTLKNGINYNSSAEGEGLLVVSVKQLFRGEYVLLEGLGSVQKEKISNYKNFLLKNGDLLFARSSLKREGAGKLAIVKDLDNENTVFSGFIIRFRNESNNDNLFLNYLLRSPKYREMFPRIANGTTITNLTQDVLDGVPLIIPPLPEQKAIASILSSLDAKIELNNKMNKTLEAIGQAVFKRWFVEGKKEEWELSTIGRELKTILGGTPSRVKPEYWDGNINWINSGKVNEFRITESSEKITEEGLKKSATSLMPKGTIVLAITGATLGQVSKLEIDTCANQSVIGILENGRLSSEYIYFWIKNKIEDIIGFQTGGAQQHINKTNVDNYPLLVPNEETLQSFDVLVKPIFKKISINCFQNQTLSQIRDTLLPKLMSGDVRVR